MNEVCGAERAAHGVPDAEDATRLPADVATRAPAVVPYPSCVSFVPATTSLRLP